MKKIVTLCTLILALAVSIMFTACPSSGGDTTEADNTAIANAKTKIEEATFTAEQENVLNIVQAKAAVQAIIERLNLGGVTAAVVGGTFTGARAGEANGTYPFTVELAKGTGIKQTTKRKTLVINATAVKAGLYTKSPVYITSDDTPVFTFNKDAPNASYMLAVAFITDAAGIYTLYIDDDLTVATGGSPGFGCILYLIGLGKERTITLTSAGSLFTVDSGAALILGGNITLKGFSANTSALVKVDGGELRMRTGSAITGNTNTTSTGTQYGGGVFVNSGTFTMEGGEIKRNRAYNGGGVYMSGGILNMAGGTIYGSDASSGLWNTANVSGEGAALRRGTSSANAYRGILSDGTFTRRSELPSSSESTIKVVNGELVP